MDGIAGEAGVDGLAIGIRIRVHHAWGGRGRAGHAGLEIGRVMELEVAVDRWHLHFVAQRGLGAGPARLHLAVLGAAVAAARVAVVAIFVEHDAVAALRGAARGARTVGLDLAVHRAAVERQAIAIVAALRALDLAVAANRGCALAAVVALVAELQVAGGRATVTAHGIAVVAGLGARLDAIAALGRAALADHAALEALLDGLAVARAAVTALRVAVVAFLAAFEDTVAALHGRACAQLPRRANAARALALAVGRTPIAVLLVAVVAHFTDGGLYDPIATAWGRFARLSRIRANPAAFELARAAAAVAAVGVAVVAVFSRFDAFVAAHGGSNARLASDAQVGRILDRAGRVTAIVVRGIAVVADLARTYLAISTNDIPRALALWRTGPVLLDLAGAVAAVAR